MFGLFLMNSLCIIPAILKIIFTSHRGMTRFKRFVIFIMDIVAIICQLSICVLFKTIYNETKSQHASSQQNQNPSLDENMLLLYMGLSSLLVSLSYWENFAQVKYSSNRAVLFVQDQINELRRHQAKIYLLVSPIKVVLMFTFAYAFMSKSVEEQFSLFSKRFNYTQQQHIGITQEFNTPGHSFRFGLEIHYNSYERLILMYYFNFISEIRNTSP